MPNCNFCYQPLEHTFCDLGHQPPSNSLLTLEQLEKPERYYPLKVFICSRCWLLQVPVSDDGFQPFNDQYPYYSSQSPSNVFHARKFTDMVCARFGYGKDNVVIEAGSNDGYMLQWFKEKGCRTIGFEPAHGPAQEAERKGIYSIERFFCSAASKSWRNKADLICSINTLAHQPDINSFVKGLKIALKPDGVTIHEFPHLMCLVEGLQLDTIYHEHYSYFSFGTVRNIFRKHGLEIFDVDEIPEHGGSLRIYAKHKRSLAEGFPISENVSEMEKREEEAGMFKLDYYREFQSKINRLKNDFLYFLILLPKDKTVAAYGSPAKGNTMLNFCGIKSDLLPFTVDRSPHKQGKFMPGSHIPIYSEEYLKYAGHQPDYVVILPWNLRNEIVEQLSYIRAWGGKFVVAVPRLEIF